MKILVTGATGKLGNKVVHNLLRLLPAENIAASVRDTEKASHLKDHGVDVRYGDFDKPETLKTAFNGIDRLLIISTDGDNETRIRQHLNAVAAAKDAGVQFIVYTSVADADNSSLSLAQVHRATEKAIRDTKIPYSFLRNNWYLLNETSNIQNALKGAPWLTAANGGKVGWAVQEDYAEAAALVLAEDGHENTVYELSGKPRTADELAKILSEVIGHEVQTSHVDFEAYSATLKSFGMPEFLVQLFTDIQKAIKDGALDVNSRDLEMILGRPQTPLVLGLNQIVEQVTVMN